MIKLQKVKSKVGNLESRLGCRRKQKEGWPLNTRSGNGKTVECFPLLKEIHGQCRTLHPVERFLRNGGKWSRSHANRKKGGWKTCIKENSARYSLGREKVIPDGSLELEKSEEGWKQKLSNGCSDENGNSNVWQCLFIYLSPLNARVTTVSHHALLSSQAYNVDSGQSWWFVPTMPALCRLR